MKPHLNPRRITAWLWLACLAALATSAHAELSGVSPSGFVVNYRQELKASTDGAWRSIVALPRWWNPQHSWSGQAANMSLDAQAGGCFCERWTDASGAAHSVQHGQVVMVHTGRVIRLFAALGPLQELAVNGVLTIVAGAGVGSEAGKNFLRISYRVSGGAEAGLDQLAPAVDKVIGEQYRRLKALIETGKAE